MPLTLPGNEDSIQNVSVVISLSKQSVSVTKVFVAQTEGSNDVTWSTIVHIFLY